LPLEHIKRIAIHFEQLHYVVDEQIVLDKKVHGHQQESTADAACVDDGERFLKFERKTRQHRRTHKQQANAEPRGLVRVEQINDNENACDNGGGGGDAIASFWESAVWERLHLVCLKYLEDKVSDL
jgi:hypothetical protein